MLNYPIHVRPTPTGNSVWIPDLNLTLDLAAEAKLTDIIHYVRRTILEILHKKSDDDEDIEFPQPLEFYTSMEEKQVDTAQYHLYGALNVNAINLEEAQGRNIFLIQEEENIKAYLIEEDANRIPNAIPVFITQNELFILNQGFLTNEPAEIIKNIYNKEIFDRIIHDVISQSNNNVWMAIDVNFKDKNRPNFCNWFFPLFTKISLVVEVVAGIPMMCGALKLTDDEFISGKDKFKNILSLVQALLFALLMLYMSFSGPAAKTLGSFGSLLDSSFLKFKRALCCKNKSSSSAPPKPWCSRENIGIGIAKFILALLIINFIILDAAMDYQQLQLLKEKSLENNSLFPNWAVIGGAWTTFAFNQFNDPAIVFSFLIYGFKEINNFFSKKRLSQNTSPSLNTHLPRGERSMLIDEEAEARGVENNERSLITGGEQAQEAVRYRTLSHTGSSTLFRTVQGDARQRLLAPPSRENRSCLIL